MTKTLKKLINQLEPSEKVELAQHIRKKYGIGMEEEEDIKNKVIKLLRREFAWIEPEKIKRSHRLEQDFALNASDVSDFANTLLKEFDLEGIPFSEVKSWATVRDIVNYIVERG